jgi:hypothetical protein
MKQSCISAYPMGNGLSGHDVQILFQKGLQILLKKNTQKNKTGPINNETTAKFQLLLQENACNSACNIYNTNSMFYFFHCILLNNFENIFPNIVYRRNGRKNKDWITNGIRISC